MGWGPKNFCIRADEILNLVGFSFLLMFHIKFGFD